LGKSRPRAAVMIEMSMPVDVPIGTPLAGYRVERLLGHGAMGAGYRARDEHLDRPVALKLLPRQLASDQRFRDRFLRESRLAATPEHGANARGDLGGR